MNDSSIAQRRQALASLSDAGQPATGLQRAAGALRTVLPHLLRLLPLLDGNVGSAVSNLLNPPQPAAPPAPPVDLEPIEHGMAELQGEHRGLRAQVLEQNASLDRIEGRLQTVEEEIASNALAQQELLTELKAVGNRVEELKVAGRKSNIFVLVTLGLLALSILANVVLLLHFIHILP
ncbi:MAG: hypothetical protein ABSC76_13175 [Terracidiphilus sp.]|jgi:hypothetical protein